MVLEAELVLDEAARARLLSRFGEGAREWCAGLPRLVEEYCSRWDLRLEHAQSGSTSRVYFGWQRGRPGRPEREVVLKVTPEPPIARTEAAALRVWAATSHAVALLDADPGGGALLLERVRPGTKLRDAGARLPAREMAELLIGLRAATGDLTHQLPPLSERIEFIFGLIRSRLTGARVAPLVDPGLVTAGHELARTLAQTGPSALVHGDLHLANILIARQPRQPRQPGQPGQPGQSDQPGRLVAIDPRPCLGDPDFDAVDWVLAPAAAGTPDSSPSSRSGPGSTSCAVWSPAWTPTGSGPGAGRRPSSSSYSTCITGRPTRGSRSCSSWRPRHDRNRLGSVRDDQERTLDWRRAVGRDVDGGAAPGPARYGLTAYHYDYQDARGHNDRRIAAQARRGEQRLARDRLVAADAVRTARQCGIEVIEVDGGQDAAAVADTVAGHFLPHLPISA